MWIVLLITHSLLAFLLLGAITHQTLSVWAPVRSKPGSFLARARAVPSGTYVAAVIVLYLLTAIMGGYIYTNYRIAARFTLEQGHFWKTFGAFELKEHFIAIGLGVLPAYWYFWRSPDAVAFTRTRNILTTILAFVIWWGFLAGQHIDVQLKDGKRRSYSIANSPKPEGVTTLELHVRHTPGGAFTDLVFSTLKVRDLLRFEGPLGTFYVREDSDKPIVMVASGTGFAPIKAMCEAAMQKGMKRPIALYWGCWTRRDMYMLGVPESWQHSNLKFIPVLSNPTPECAWTGRTGFVHRAVMEDLPDLSGVQVYACGAPVMVEAARADFSAKCALPPEEFYADAFLTEADKAAA